MSPGTLHYADDWLTVYQGDCREVLAELPAESVHCVCYRRGAARVRVKAAS